MRKSETVVPDVEEAYSSFRPLLLSALGKLARQGFVTPPSEGLDLIHDFFLEAWPGIQKNYDPEKGKLPTYVYGAFLRFARPRITRLRQIHNQLVNPMELASSVKHEPYKHLETEFDMQAIDRILSDFPSERRRILRAYFGPHPVSQRHLANELGVSRYRMRELLMQALAQLAIRLDKPNMIEEIDWHLLKLVLQGGKSIEQAAIHLGLTVTQGRNRYADTLKQLFYDS